MRCGHEVCHGRGHNRLVPILGTLISQSFPRPPNITFTFMLTQSSLKNLCWVDQKAFQASFPLFPDPSGSASSASAATVPLLEALLGAADNGRIASTSFRALWRWRQKRTAESYTWVSAAFKCASISVNSASLSQGVGETCQPRRHM